MSHLLRLLACLLTLLCLSRPAQATRCAAIVGGTPALSQVDATTRLRFIQRRLQHAALRARIWSYTWGSTYATLTAVNLAISPAFDHNQRIDYFVSSGSSAIGVATFLISPLKVMRDQRTLHQRLARFASLPSTAQEQDRCALLHEAEFLFLRDAAGEAFGKSLLVRFGGVIFNIGVGALLGFGFQHWGQASINLMAGVVVGQVMIATQPDDVVTDLAHYRTGDLASAANLATGWPGPWIVAPLLSSGSYGFQLAGPF